MLNKLSLSLFLLGIGTSGMAVGAPSNTGPVDNGSTAQTSSAASADNASTAASDKAISTLDNSDNSVHAETDNSDNSDNSVHTDNSDNSDNSVYTENIDNADNSVNTDNTNNSVRNDNSDNSDNRDNSVSQTVTDNIATIVGADEITVTEAETAVATGVLTGEVSANTITLGSPGDFAPSNVNTIEKSFSDVNGVSQAAQNSGANSLVQQNFTIQGNVNTP